MLFRSFNGSALRRVQGSGWIVGKSPEEIAANFEGAKRTGPGQWQAKCPAHEDRQASLSIGGGADGRTLVHCHAGCAAEDVLASVGLAMADLAPAIDRPQSQIVAVYDYRDATGKLIAQSVRKEPKAFLQRRPNEAGGWTYSVKGLAIPLYNLPGIVASGPESPVYIPEGEKDADALVRRGLVATTNIGGAGKWRDEYSDYLAGRNVVILPDNDDTGRKHARDIARKTFGKATSIKIVLLPGLPPKGDVSDFLANGGTLEQLLELVAACEPWAPEREAVDDDDIDDDELPATLPVGPQASLSLERLEAMGGRAIREHDCKPIGSLGLIAVFVEADPRIALLYGFRWPGAIQLSASQYLNGKQVRVQAFEQKCVVLPKKLERRWNESLAGELAKKAPRIEPPPEFIRGVIVARALHRLLIRDQRILREGEPCTSNGLPARLSDDSVTFSFDAVAESLIQGVDRVGKRELSQACSIAKAKRYQPRNGRHLSLMRVLPDGLEALKVYCDYGHGEDVADFETQPIELAAC